MGVYRGAIDHGMRRRAALGCERFEELAPDALYGKVDMKILAGLARAVDHRRVGPPAARPLNMHNAADHATFVNPQHAMRLDRQVGLETSELCVSQPEKIRSDRHAPVRAPLNCASLCKPVNGF